MWSPPCFDIGNSSDCPPKNLEIYTLEILSEVSCWQFRRYAVIKKRLPVWSIFQLEALLHAFLFEWNVYKHFHGKLAMVSSGGDDDLMLAVKRDDWSEKLCFGYVYTDPMIINALESAKWCFVDMLSNWSDGFSTIKFHRDLLAYSPETS